MLTYSLSEICHYISSHYEMTPTNESMRISKITTPDSADENSLVFIHKDHPQKNILLKQTKAGIVICDPTIDLNQKPDKTCVILVTEPKLIFAEISQHLFLKKETASIHETAIIHKEAIIGKDVSIGPYTYVGRCEIKNNVNISGHCYLYDNVKIAENVQIDAGSIIGVDGLGHVKHPSGHYIPFPHLGGVRIQSNVKIGAHTVIAGGALKPTIIKSGSIIDSFVQIGHNVIINENVLILSHSIVGGSSVIEKGVFIALNVTISDYLTIGEKAHIGPGAIIMQSVKANANVISRMPITLPLKDFS